MFIILSSVGSAGRWNPTVRAYTGSHSSRPSGASAVSLKYPAKKRNTSEGNYFKVHNHQIIGYFLGCIPDSTNSINATFDICYCLDMSLTKQKTCPRSLFSHDLGQGGWDSRRHPLSGSCALSPPPLHLPCRTLQPSVTGWCNKEGRTLRLGSLACSILKIKFGKLRNNSFLFHLWYLFTATQSRPFSHILSRVFILRF